MRLFGSSDGPHMAHFHCVHRGDEVEGRWEVRNCEGLKWRVLRLGERFAESAEIGSDSSQTLVVEGDATHFRDAVPGLGKCFYTVFSQEDGKDWERQAAIKISAREHLFWHHPDAGKLIGSVADSDLNPVSNPRSPFPLPAIGMALDAASKQKGVAQWLHCEH